ncbi:MAG: hypothetical protein JNL82_05665 [Myxococcales bacterium]|nr:hypothetical protein [Myxococcales bacterium]
MEPLDPELRRVVREGLAEAMPGAEVEERVLAGLMARLPTAGGPDGGSTGEPDPGPSFGGGPAAAATNLAGGVKALVLGGVLAVGAIVAATATRGPAPVEATPRTPAAGVEDVPRDRSTAAPATPRTEPSPAPGDAAEQPGRRERRAPRATEARVAADEAATADALLAETRGLAAAEEALGRGDFAETLARVRALDASHPAGQLRLEREAVAICARCGLEEPDAGAAAREFLRAHAGAAVAAKLRARCAEALRKNSPTP